MEELEMRRFNAFASLIFVLILVIGAGIAWYSYSGPADAVGTLRTVVITFIIATIVSAAIKVADQWEKAVVLRLGKFRVINGPGLFFIIPVIDTIPYWIDTRVITTTFKTEKTLTKDTVPVDVDAVLFWKVIDAKKAALDVADYQSAISWASQTALRDVIGKTMLSDMLEGREKSVRNFRELLMNELSPGA
jgi:regulator of protease activity HflC (stomatin/prohibitin superfamily)